MADRAPATRRDHCAARSFTCQAVHTVVFDPGLAHGRHNAAEVRRFGREIGNGPLPIIPILLMFIIALKMIDRRGRPVSS
ncbi:hypothetical protein LB577_08970 [Mesorhizobium sp. B283B1A]|uniref:hypothetical protein n=1 Tax=Mesorhizobium TaxID=68287 RepID=UPI001CD0BEC8|nr:MULTISPECIES: hypothetical protein [Mesorhizobium]MCA0047089.1 hypothetical protein [Mesorhizobium sp. B283B1A]UQS65380.1 hypothetical protein M5D98_03130 [Mesorhizobium opportunistum]